MRFFKAHIAIFILGPCILTSEQCKCNKHTNITSNIASEVTKAAEQTQRELVVAKGAVTVAQAAEAARKRSNRQEGRAATTLQTFARGHKAQQEFKTAKNAATTLQTFAKGHKTQQEAKKTRGLKKKNNSRH